MHQTKAVSSHHVYVLSSTMVLPVRHVLVRTKAGVRLTNTLVKPDASKYLFQLIACWVILHAFLLSADVFQNNLFQKILSGISAECQTVWIQIRPDESSGLIWVWTVCKGYQQTALAGKELQDFEQIVATATHNDHNPNTLMYLQSNRSWAVTQK